MNRLPLVILSLLVLGSVGFGLSQLNEVGRLRHDATAWDQEKAELQKRIWALQKRNTELENRRANETGKPAIETAEAEVTADDPRRDESGGPPRGRPARFDGGRFTAMMSNPEVQKLMALQQKAGLDARYSSLFKQLQLNPAELEKFKSLLVDKQAAVMDVVAAARAEGLTGPEGRDQIRQLVKDAQNQVDNTIKSTLGDAAYAQYQSYEATLPQRNVVSQLEQRLSYSSTPLTDAQSQSLVQILTATAPSGGNSGRAALGGSLPFGGAGMGALGGGSAPITNEAVAQAQGILSAQQFAALQSLQQEQAANAQLRNQMRATMQAQGSGSTGPAAAPKSPGSIPPVPPGP